MCSRIIEQKKGYAGNVPEALGGIPLSSSIRYGILCKRAAVSGYAFRLYAGSVKSVNHRMRLTVYMSAI